LGCIYKNGQGDSGRGCSWGPKNQLPEKIQDTTECLEELFHQPFTRSGMQIDVDQANHYESDTRDAWSSRHNVFRRDQCDAMAAAEGVIAKVRGTPTTISVSCKLAKAETLPFN